MKAHVAAQKFRKTGDRSVFNKFTTEELELTRNETSEKDKIYANIIDTEINHRRENDQIVQQSNITLCMQYFRDHILGAVIAGLILLIIGYYYFN